MNPSTDFDARPPGFATTLWTEVLGAAATDPERRRKALETVIQAYWPALYGLARRRGHAPEDAQDAVQEFFADIIERRGFAAADRDKGRFRTYLRAAFTYFLADERDRRRALKRGGGHTLLSLDFRAGEKGLAIDVADPRTPESHFDRDWAKLMVEKAMSALQREGADYDLLGATLGPQQFSTDDLADRFKLKPHDVKNRLFRARRRLRELLLDEIRAHLENPAEAEDELRELWNSLR